MTFNLRALKIRMGLKKAHPRDTCHGGLGLISKMTLPTSSPQGGGCPRGLLRVTKKWPLVRVRRLGETYKKYFRL